MAMKQRFIRMDDHLWEAATETARRRNTDVSTVVRELLAEYVDRNRLVGGPIDGSVAKLGPTMVVSNEAPPWYAPSWDADARNEPPAYRLRERDAHRADSGG